MKMHFINFFREKKKLFVLFNIKTMMKEEW